MVGHFLKRNLNHRRAQRIWAEVKWRLASSDWDFFYKKALKTENFPLPLVYDYAYLLMQSEDFSGVISLLGQFDPNEQVNEFEVMRAHVFFKTRCYTRALQSIDKLMARGDATPAALRTKAKCELALAQYEEALESGRKLIALSQSPEQGDWALLASIFKRAGLYDSYRNLYDFDRLVTARFLAVPAGFSSRSIFHEELVSSLEALHGSLQHPLEQSLRNGTQTDGHLFATSEGTIQHLAAGIKQHVAQWVNQLKNDSDHPFLRHSGKRFDFSGSWSVKLKKDGYHKNHYHNAGWISGCYYVSANKELTADGQGWLKLGESELLEDDSADYLIRPEEGLLVLFPSYFWHGTTPFQRDGNRLTVAFDIYPEE
ncbi:MAG: hypothetical protein HLX52_04615 [Idiomarinaceae bacterium]|uniref:putative 2OG-Fe(II) oxygenase n=1 Tax=Idiomarina sp. 28-8 TaxID=1260624 RepID=UPI0002E860F8|nr:putative 2OG-Fe(II) oxygenase [Idiomarina sp. 28-8]NWO02230.1 hypothetical protein [Idiomarinaceae bacterium]